MKIHITENIDKALENYTVVPILYGKIDLGLTPNNSATHIIAIDALDSVPSNLLVEFVTKIFEKMRIGCELVIGGTELSAISRDVIQNNITTPEYNELIFSKRGIYKSEDIIKLLLSANLTINNIQIKGHKYELTASRQNPKN